MHAIIFDQNLPAIDPRSLLDVQRDRPSPSPHDVLVAIKAVSVNPADVKIRAGGDVTPKGRILGFDASGIIEEIGSAVTHFKPGDAVFYAGSIARPGTNAEFHLVDERIIGRKPTSLTFEQAAAVPLTALTASELLFERIGVKQGAGADQRTILVIGGAGGVGSMAIQYLRALTDVTIIATASRPESIDWVREMGAHHVIDHHQPLKPQLAALGFEGVHIVLSLTATKTHAPAIPDLLLPGGHLGLIEGADSIAAFDAQALFRRSIQIHLELMFTRPLFQPEDMATQRDILNGLAHLIDAGKMRSTMTSALTPISAETLRTAHQMVESGSMIGKVVVGAL